MVYFFYAFFPLIYFSLFIKGGTEGKYNKGIDKATNNAIKVAQNTMDQENSKRGMFKFRSLIVFLSKKII